MGKSTVVYKGRFLVVTALCAIIGLAAQAQELQGKLGRTTSGSMGLRFVKRSNEPAPLGIVTPQRGLLPIVLPQAVASALANNNSARFPLCVVGASANGVKVDRLPGASGSQSLSSSTGAQVPYSVGLARKGGGQPPAAGADSCTGGSVVEVEVTIRSGNQGRQSSLSGVIPILMITE